MHDKLLIDSHVLIWMLYEPKKLGPKTTELLQQAETLFISSGSLWELALKFAKGKLAYTPEELTQGAKALGLERLAINDKHLVRLVKIDLPQSDPFDRLVIAQAEEENLWLVTVDKVLLSSKYQTIDAKQ